LIKIVHIPIGINTVAGNRAFWGMTLDRRECNYFAVGVNGAIQPTLNILALNHDARGALKEVDPRVFKDNSFDREYLVEALRTPTQLTFVSYKCAVLFRADRLDRHDPGALIGVTEDPGLVAWLKRNHSVECGRPL